MKNKNDSKQSKQQKSADNSRQEIVAKMRTNSLVSSAVTIQSLFANDDCDLGTLCKSLSDQLKGIKTMGKDDLLTMLTTQSQVLQAMFHLGAENVSQAELFSQRQAYFDMAIRAQNACRKTLLAVHQIKNPKSAMFIKQQNNAVNQQVNNNQPNLKNIEKPSNELLSEVPHATLDTGRKSQTSQIDSPVEALVKSGSEDT